MPASSCRPHVFGLNPLRWIELLRQQPFVRAVGVLVGGTALGHAITAAAMPVLTRLYSPEEFGILAAFSAILSIVVVAVCLRYEVAIAMPEREDEAANLLAVAALCALTLSAIFAVVLLIAEEGILARIGQPGLAPYLWLLPLCTAYAGVFAALQFWLVRRREFASLATSRVLQSGSASGLQIGLGMAGTGPLGLVLGLLANSATGCLALLARLRHVDRTALDHVSWRGMGVAAWRQRNYPLYSAGEALANSASIQLPVLLIAGLGSSSEAGHLMLAMFVVQAPMALLGSAVSQVFLSRAPVELRAGTLGRFTIEVVGGLFRTGAGPLLALGIVAPFVFVPIFGDEWSRAGVVVSWLTPWFVLHFLTAPVSMALHVTGRQRIALLLQILGLLARVGAVAAAAGLLGGSLTEAYALSGLVFYALYLAAILGAVDCRGTDLISELRKGLRSCLFWAIPALVAVATVRGMGWL